jgi:hypothetical protein
MNCELAQEQIVAVAYGELAGELAGELERHISVCADCRQEREQLLALRHLADAWPAAEPSPNLVARARLRLDEALDALPPRRWYHRMGQYFWNNLAALEAAPAAVLLLLAAGAGAGVLGGYRYAQVHSAAATAAVPANPPASPKTPPAAALPELANVANVSGIVRRPNSDMVQVSYNQLVPRQIEGSAGDPAIRQLLMLATQNSGSAGVRDDSVALLAAECRAGHSCQPAGIRQALMVALRYDHSAKVRQKALEGLEPYVADDMRVRDAVLEAVLNDSDPSVRSAAISLLAPVEADTSVRQVLYSVSNSDENPQIRNVSRQFLSRPMEIQ